MSLMFPRTLLRLGAVGAPEEHRKVKLCEGVTIRNDGCHALTERCVTFKWYVGKRCLNGMLEKNISFSNHLEKFF